MTDTTTKLFEKAKQAFEQQNFDYAIDLFQQVLKGEPGNRQARTLLRESEVRKANENGHPNKYLASIIGLVPCLKMMIYSDPEAVIDACEEYLKIDPTDLPTRLRLAKKLKELDHIDAAIGELKPLLKMYEEEPDLHKELAILYEAQGKNKQSANHLQRLKDLDPTDREVDSMLKNTMAESTVEEGGWEDAESTQDLIRDKQKAQQLERDQKILSDPEEIREAIEDLRDEIPALDNESEKVEQWNQIAKHYQKLDEYDNAISALESAQELRPEDGQLKMNIGDLQIKKEKEKIKAIQEKLEDQPDNEKLKKKEQKLQKQLLKTQINEYKQRVKEHPTDMKLRFHLGRHLFNAGKYDEAISQFQEAVKDPKIRTKAYNYLGQGFMKKDHPDMAVDQFKQGLEEARSEDRKMELKYYLANAYMKNDDWEQAEANLREILQEDYGYKDAADLLEKTKKHLE